MTFPRLRFTHKQQMGFTLVEMLVAIALVGLISLGIAAAIMQVLTINVDASNHMIAIRQVQQAGKEVSKDTLQAQSVTCDGSDGFPLTLAWTGWEGPENVVVYTITEDNKLQRSHNINGARIIAKYIDPDPENTYCEFVDGVLTFKVTATVGGGPQGASETRVYEVEPRPDQTT